MKRLREEDCFSNSKRLRLLSDDEKKEEELRLHCKRGRETTFFNSRKRSVALNSKDEQLRSYIAHQMFQYETIRRNMEKESIIVNANYMSRNQKLQMLHQYLKSRNPSISQTFEEIKLPQRKDENRESTIKEGSPRSDLPWFMLPDEDQVMDDDNGYANETLERDREMSQYPHTSPQRMTSNYATTSMISNPSTISGISNSPNSSYHSFNHYKSTTSTPFSFMPNQHHSSPFSVSSSQSFPHSTMQPSIHSTLQSQSSMHSFSHTGNSQSYAIPSTHTHEQHSMDMTDNTDSTSITDFTSITNSARHASHSEAIGTNFAPHSVFSRNEEHISSTNGLIMNGRPFYCSFEFKEVNDKTALLSEWEMSNPVIWPSSRHQ